jgi:hypothetical protein
MLQQVDSAIAFAVVMLILSLIITALVQIVNASFDVRGLNLVWALTRLFHEVDPSLRVNIGKKKWYELFRPTMGRRLAQAVCRYKPLTSGIAGRAKAIRSDELLLVLRQMATQPPADLPAEVHRVLVKLVNDRVPGRVEEVEVAEVLMANLVDGLDPALAKEWKPVVEDAVRNAVGTVSKMEYKVDQWFLIVMERSSEIFAAHSKVYTFVFGVILAFGWHVDSGQILHQVSTNSDVRNNLNRAADSVLAQGDKLLQSKHVNASFNQLYENSKQLADTLKNTSAITCADEGEAWLASNADKLPPYGEDVQQAIKATCKASGTTDNQNKADPDKADRNKDTRDFTVAFKPVLAKAETLAASWAKAPVNLDRCAEGVRWIEANKGLFTGVDATGEFQKECDQKARASLGDAGDSITSLRKSLDNSTLQISTTLLRRDGKDIVVEPFSLAGYGYWPHLMGTLATVLLLSLGAPFWFNTLQQLSNLKPLVAQKIEDESEAAGSAAPKSTK